MVRYPEYLPESGANRVNRSAEGAANRKLSWAFLEMFAHSLEDMITDRLLQGKSFAKKNGPTLSKVIPAEAITTSQSLKPYARSLSHELRTPMQGVVGMLDIMQSNVSEAIEIADNDDVKHVFAELMSNIQRAQGQYNNLAGSHGHAVALAFALRYWWCIQTVLGQVVVSTSIIEIENITWGC